MFKFSFSKMALPSAGIFKNAMEVPKRCAWVIGKFNGVHLGHARLIEHALNKAKALSVPLYVLTFWPYPNCFFKDETCMPILSKDMFSEVLGAYGISGIYQMAFNKKLASMDASNFVKDVIIQELEPIYIGIGHGFRFGYKRQGTVDLMVARMKLHLPEAQVDALELLQQGEIVVSSTVIETAIKDGDMQKAWGYMGRPWVVSGEVLKGRQVGSSIGFPTLNISIENVIKPKYGVYGGYVQDELGVYHACAINIGIRPTVSDSKVPLLEAHMLGYNADMYGQRVRIYVTHFVRKERRMGSLEELKAQIQRDVREVRLLLSV